MWPQVLEGMRFHSLKRFFLGEPLSTHLVREEKIPKWKALAVLSSDALSSVAYATEEILIPLALFSVAALAYSVPIALAIATLLIIVTVSYRQTVDAYPHGGGAYQVSKENLGVHAGLVAGASLLIDYVLTVAVSTAAGVTALTSAFPELMAWKIPIAFLVIALITTLNLRGIRESATIFALPTYIFIFSFLAMLVVGVVRAAMGDLPRNNPILHSSYEVIPLFLLLRAFSSGCAAMTGIEAISNAVPSFRHPSSRNAKITMGWMALLLCVFFFGVTALAHVFGVLPQENVTAVSQLAKSIFGESFMFYLIQVSTALILFLAANTAYSGFPWLASVMAKDRFLPRQLAMLGDKLVFSNSILGLGLASMFLVWLFNCETHALVPLYTVGVFLGFTLSQSGMLRHHLKHRSPGWRTRYASNLIGALTTGIVMLVVSVSKFAEGAWIVILLVPVLVLVFSRVHKHYLDVGKELTLQGAVVPASIQKMKHTVIIPISGIHRGVVDAIRYAASISDDVRACYIEIDPEATARIQQEWKNWGHEIPFVILKSPYRSVIRPLLEYIDDIDQVTHREMVTVVIPEFVTAKWWHQILHNQTAFVIRTALMFRPHTVVTSVRYHLKST